MSQDLDGNKNTSTNDPSADIGGGQGEVPAWENPDLLLSSPAGIFTATPKDHIVSAGAELSFVAQDIATVAQANYTSVIQKGICLFTYGKAANPQKPNQETGIKLHAASGNVNVQAQSDAVHITADKAIEVSSTQADVLITAPKHILLTAGGAGIKIEAGKITLYGPGKLEIKASQKIFTGPAGAQLPPLQLPRPEGIEHTYLRKKTVKFSA